MDIIEQHYRENFERLSKQWGRRFDNPHIGFDVVQTAYERAIRYFHTYDQTQKFDNWFGRILHNAYKDTRNEELGHAHEEIDEFAIPGVENSNEVDRLMVQILERISKERQEHQHVLVYAFQYGYTPTEISHFSDLTHRNIRKIVSDYRNKIRKILQ